MKERLEIADKYIDLLRGDLVKANEQILAYEHEMDDLEVRLKSGEQVSCETDDGEKLGILFPMKYMREERKRGRPLGSKNKKK